MSTPSLKIQAHGTPSSLVPGSIQNARNNNLEILTIVQTIPANESGSDEDVTLSGIIGSDLAGKEIVGSTADFSAQVGTGGCSIGTVTNNDLLASANHPADAVNLLATLSYPVTAGGSIKVYLGAAGTNPFTLTLRLILRKL